MKKKLSVLVLGVGAAASVVGLLQLNPGSAGPIAKRLPLSVSTSGSQKREIRSEPTAASSPTSDAEGNFGLGSDAVKFEVSSELTAFSGSERALKLRALLGEGPFAKAYFESFLASENAANLPGFESTRDRIVSVHRDVFEKNAAALWTYVRERTSSGAWEGFERERYLLVASASEAPENRAAAVELLASLVAEDPGEGYLTGAALLATRMANADDAEQIAQAILAGREDPEERAQVVNLLRDPFPEVAQKLSSRL